MTLRECYIEHSYYYLKLEWEMKRIIGQNGHVDKAIEAFCSGTMGDLRLDCTEDYKNILDIFRHFIAGATWALSMV